MLLPPPAQLAGFPAKYSVWYPGQSDLFSKLADWVDSPARFLGLPAATGLGKSVLAVLLARLTGFRTVILTATKGLESQYVQEFSEVGLVDVRGQNNFPCALNPAVTADQGPCHESMPCNYASLPSGCAYRQQFNTAMNADIIVTNYAYYFAQTQFSSGLGDISLLVLDESHLAFGAMENHLTMYLSRFETEPLGISFPTVTDLWELWQAWAADSLPVAVSAVNRIEADIKRLRQEGQRFVPSSTSRAYRAAKSVMHNLERLKLARGQWVIQQTARGGFRFTPVWVADYSGALFGSVPKVLLMSAVLAPKTADSLGVPADPAQRAWIDVGSYFPPLNTPIWHIPTARINYRTDDYGTTAWLSRIDQIISRRLDRKGIIFTVSYERARLLASRSSYKDIMLTHSTADVTQVVNKFKLMPPPAVLVSPTVTTGWDFPAAATGCRYAIVGKVPYPDTQDPVVRARHEADKDWSSFQAMGTLVQECGRLTRSATDRAEILVVDDNLRWFIPQFRQFAPKWFLQRYRGSLRSVPDPLV